MGGARSVPALGNSLAWFGSAVGGILMGRVADRFGIRWTVMFGSVMICVGLFISTGGEPWQLYLGHGLFMGFLGNAGLNAPLYVYVSHWFDRRRGSALALISSGGYLAGFVWPTDLRARYRELRLALDHDRLRLVPGRADRSAGGDISCARRRKTPLPLDASGVASGETEGARLAAERRVRSDRGRIVHVLRDDVDAAGTYRRAVHRPRHFGDDRRRDALGVARRGSDQPARPGGWSPTASADCVRRC